MDPGSNAIPPAILRSGHLEKGRPQEGKSDKTGRGRRKKWKSPRKPLARRSAREAPGRDVVNIDERNPLTLSPIGNWPDLNPHLVITSAPGRKIDIRAAGEPRAPRYSSLFHPPLHKVPREHRSLAIPRNGVPGIRSLECILREGVRGRPSAAAGEVILLAERTLRRHRE